MKEGLKSRLKKILVVCPTLDLDKPFGATPAIWQLLKSLYELECELIVVPYLGKSIRSLWWRNYDNPCQLESNLYKWWYFKHKSIKEFFKRDAKKIVKKSLEDNEGITPKLTRILTTPKWKNHITKIFEYEKDIDAVLFIQIPLNQIKGLATHIKKDYSVPILYYELDVPTSLPEFGGFSFNHFLGADLAEFDAFIIPSEGSKKRLLEMGAQEIFILHFGVDPDVYLPVKTDYFIDVFFSGNGSWNREKSIQELITHPSKTMDAKFVVSGRGFDIDIGNSENIPSVPFSSWRTYCCASRINLNIPRENHALTYATSTSRPFELAAMKCCIVSSEYLGLEKWFDTKKEILVAENHEDAKELYEWLLSNDDMRLELAENAHQRVLRDHTFINRGIKILNIIDKVKS